MNDFLTVFTAVALGNLLSIVAATYINAYLSHRDAKRRRAEIDALWEKIDARAEAQDEVLVKPVKKAVAKKVASPSRTKKQA